MNKTDVLETLAVLGFEVEEIPDFGFLFRYEGLSIVYMPDDDENFLRFAAPHMFDVTEDNRAFVLEINTVRCAYMEIRCGLSMSTDCLAKVIWRTSLSIACY